MSPARHWPSLAAKPMHLSRLSDRNFSLAVLDFHLKGVSSDNRLQAGTHCPGRSAYSFCHSAITFTLLDGQGNYLLALAPNARIIVDVINTFYSITATGEQNIDLL